MIEVRNLTKRFGAKVAVDDLTFTVEPGVVTGFLGPNGAGKSTTMRLILGLDRPDSGAAFVNGKPFTTSTSPLREVGALLDAGDLHRGRRAVDHLLALARSNGIGKARVGEVLEMVGLESVARQRLKGFSLGMTQRLGLAATMLGDPPVLLFDEPVNGLDPEGISWIRSFMRSMAAQGRTVLVSSHLMSEMALTADHLVVIGRGRLLADVATRDFIGGGSTSSVNVRCPQRRELGRVLAGRGATVRRAGGYLEVQGVTCVEVGELAAEHGLVIHELFEAKASLEEAFLEMTKGNAEYEAGRTGA